MKKRSQLMNLTFLSITAIFVACGTQKEEKWVLKSPDSNILISVELAKTDNQKTSLTYEVTKTLDGAISSVIETSPLGLNRKDEQFSENLAFLSKSEVKTIDETYKMVIGRRQEIRNNANEIELNFENANGAPIQLVLRAYNDGVAFKYVFPNQSDSIYTVTNELTGFKLPAEGKVWIEEYDKPTKHSPAYEKYYQNGVAIGTPSPNTEGWAFPALFNTNNNWILLAEANLTSNFCGVRLEQNAPDGLYKIRFPEKEDGLGVGEVEPTSTLPWTMPWRTIIVGSTLGTIVESEMINNVSDAQIAGDFSWVKPGRSSWSWLTEPDSPKDFNALKRFIDLSAEMGWEYTLVDANWDLMKGGDIKQLIAYAKEKDVDVLMWYNSGGPHNIVTERPREIMYDPQARKAEFAKLKEWGVKGVKIDFWHSDKQILIQQYIDVLKDAADNEIMVNFHGCTIPRGWSRTYPNLVTLESVAGAENYIFNDSYPNEAAVQNSILPFTRNVIGPMDYTPFVISDQKYPHTTSFAHELALTLVFNSGILHFGDNGASYSKVPEYVKDFMKTVPVVFDETKFISGEPGKSIVLAARKGTDWYVAGINSLNEPMDLSVKMPFISTGQYNMSLITDGENVKSFANQQGNFIAGDSIVLTMASQGGFVATLKSK